MSTIWLVYDPEDGWSEYRTEAEGMKAFEATVESYNDESGDGWHDDAESVALYRAERVAHLELHRTATAHDGTEEGERCAEAGWDYFAEGVIKTDAESSCATERSSDSALPPPERCDSPSMGGSDGLR